MSDLNCRDCGLDLERDPPGTPPTPCPRCGSTLRAITLRAEAGVFSIRGGSATLSVTPNLVEQWRHRQNVASAVASSQSFSAAAGLGVSAEVIPGTPLPDVLLAAEVVTIGGRTPDGQLVVGVSVPWFEIIRQLETDPGFLFTVPWRKLEEMIAGAFERDGWPEVVLTPRSRDGGRDVIATRPGVGCVRIIGQVKAYHAGHVVDAEEVKAVCFTRDLDRASKAMVMTTSRFAPGILADARLQPHIPHQLELMDGVQLREWLLTLQKKM